jgi:UPF0755 protein
MRRNGNPTRFLIAASVLATLGCCGVWIVGMAIFGVPQAFTRLGPAYPDLNPILSTYLSIYLLANEKALDAPAGNPEVNIELEVAEGKPASVAIDQLREAGVLNNAPLLRNYMRYYGLDVSIEAGRFKVHGGMSIREIAEVLQSADITQDFFTIPEGWRVEEIAEALPIEMFDIEPDDFLSATRVRPLGYSFTDDLPEPPTLEGFLFPDTYHIDADFTAVDLVLAMLDNFEKQVGSDMHAAFNHQGLTIFEAVTLASIIEREAVVAEEQPIIASVFLNRLALDMKLEADPTIQYTLGKQESGWWKVDLTLDDINYDSPYNTYRYGGLPPGPIANPGLSALRAVAFPDETSYLFFRALCDKSGRHVFATTFEEHQQNACP